MEIFVRKNLIQKFWSAKNVSVPPNWAPGLRHCVQTTQAQKINLYIDAVACRGSLMPGANPFFRKNVSVPPNWAPGLRHCVQTTQAQKINLYIDAVACRGSLMPGANPFFRKN